MEKIKNENKSTPSHNVASYFVALEDIINSQINTLREKKAAWRQQSIVLKSLDGAVVDDFAERHWIQCCSFMENCEEIHKYAANDLPKCEHHNNIEFPDVDRMDFPNDANVYNKIFETPDFNINNRPCESSIAPHVNESEYLSSKKHNTMESFLHGYMLNANAQQSFSSARQLLSKQTLKKQLQSDDTINPQHILSNNIQKPDIGFNFSATKKSLGSLGRVINSTRKNFVSPVASKSVKDTIFESEDVDTEMALTLTHPSLKNIDPKMVELINNEIIHKFKPVDWNEIAGLDYAKSIIKEAVVYPLLRPDIFTGLRRPPKGILLFGPPGTGKTLIGKCIASQSSSTFFSISSAALTSKWMGEGEKMVRALFAVAVARQPSVIFIDEIDSILSQRSENENEGTRRLKTEFLVRLDGAATLDDDRVLIVAATNRPQELDEAVRRRFVKRLYVPLPDIDARSEILTNLLKTIENNINSSQIKEISQLAEGYSGADMDSLCREASMEPLRTLFPQSIITFDKKNLRHVNVDDFYSALKKIRPSVSQSDLNQYLEWNKMYGSSF